MQDKGTENERGCHLHTVLRDELSAWVLFLIKKKIFRHPSPISSIPYPLCLLTTNLVFVSMGLGFLFFVLDSVCRRDHMVFVFV